MGKLMLGILSKAANRHVWPTLVLMCVLILHLAATARAEISWVKVVTIHQDTAMGDTEVLLYSAAGKQLDHPGIPDAEGALTFHIPAGAYKFCVNPNGARIWSDVVHTLPGEQTHVTLDLEQLARDNTRDPNPVRFDGTPPEKEPVMLASLTEITGILTQSTVAAASRNKLYWFINDHLGTPVMIIDENQAVVWEGSHAPFGDTIITANTIKNNFRFPGQYFDTESGLHYNYHRYYDPFIGRYLMADPIGLVGGVNLFAYANLSPINLIDPFGLEESWRVLSRSMSVTGGVPPGIEGPPIPWKKYGKVLQPSKQSLSGIKRTAMIFTTASYTVGNVQAAGVFVGIGGIATALESSLYSKTPCNDAVKEGAKNLVPAPPILVPIKNEMVDKAIDMYIEHNDLPQM